MVADPADASNGGAIGPRPAPAYFQTKWPSSRPAKKAMGSASKTSSDQARTVAGWRITSLTAWSWRPGGKSEGVSILIAGRTAPIAGSTGGSTERGSAGTTGGSTAGTTGGRTAGTTGGSTTGGGVCAKYAST